jgi:hypothetical protein
MLARACGAVRIVAHGDDQAGRRETTRVSRSHTHCSRFHRSLPAVFDRALLA